MVQRHLLLKYLNRNIMLETGHGTLYKGQILDLDDWGIEFLPDDKDLKLAIISWDDIRKIILVDEDKSLAKEKSRIGMQLENMLKKRAKQKQLEAAKKTNKDLSLTSKDKWDRGNVPTSLNNEDNIKSTVVNENLTKVLVVEDDSTSMELVSEILKAKSFTVHCAKDGAEALEKTEEELYNLILMDLALPKIDGIKATEMIKRNLPYKKVPIIALTAYTMKWDKERVLKAGFEDYIPKPINFPEFITKLEKYRKLQVKNRSKIF